MSTLNYVQSYFKDFHKHKDILFEFWTYKSNVKDERYWTKALNALGSQCSMKLGEDSLDKRKFSLQLHQIGCVNTISGICRAPLEHSPVLYRDQCTRPCMSDKKSIQSIQLNRCCNPDTGLYGAVVGIGDSNPEPKRHFCKFWEY